MKLGDCCIASYGRKTKGKARHTRHYGIITDIGDKRVTIALSSGKEITRNPEQIAVYKLLPPTWHELYENETRININRPYSQRNN